MKRNLDNTVRRPGLRLNPVVVALIALSAVVFLRTIDPAFVAQVRSQTFDLYQRLAPRSAEDLPVRIVSIDDRSLSRLGQWPWPRSTLAELGKVLHELGAATTVYSFLFAEPDRSSLSRLIEDVKRRPGGLAPDVAAALAVVPGDNDELLAATFREGPTVVGFAASNSPNDLRPALKSGFAYSSANPATVLPAFPGTTPPLRLLEEAALGVGGMTVGGNDSSGILRRVPVLLSDGQSTYPSLSIEALRVAQQARSIVVRSTGSSGEQAFGSAALVDLRVGSLRVPLTGTGELWMYYSPSRPDRYLSAADILNPATREALRGAIEGHIVYVGATAQGLSDGRVTPLGEVIPGVAVHAQVTEQILAGVFLNRPDWADGAEIVATVVFGLGMIGLLTLIGSRFSFLAGGFIAGLAVATSWLTFSYGHLLLDPIYPSLGALAVYVSMTAAIHVTTDRERQFIRQAFGQYLAPSLLSELEKSPHRMKLGGEVRPISILFMDVRSFTPISEALTATELVHFLNSLLSPLSDAIQDEGGTIDKYIGDSIMAFWNAPVEVPDHARKACRAALRMRELLKDLNARDAFGFSEAAHPELTVRIGVGINTGEACVGNMGSERRFNYSAVGDTVNVAARIEARSKDYEFDLLISEETAAFVPDFALLELGEVTLKGKKKAGKLFALVGDEETARTLSFKELSGQHAAMIQAAQEADFAKAARIAEDCRRLAWAGVEPLYGSLKRQYEGSILRENAGVLPLLTAAEDMLTQLPRAG